MGSILLIAGEPSNATCITSYGSLSVTLLLGFSGGKLFLAELLVEEIVGELIDFLLLAELSDEVLLEQETKNTSKAKIGVVLIFKFSIVLFIIWLDVICSMNLQILKH